MSKRHDTDGNHKHLTEFVQRTVTDPLGIFYDTDTVHQAEASMVHFVRPKDESRPDSSYVNNPGA
jgi:hypothetical protein